MKRILLLTIAFVTPFAFDFGPAIKEKQSKRFLKIHIAKVKPLTIKSNLAYWDASTTGKLEDYERFNKSQLEVGRVYSNPKEFTFLKDIRESGRLRDAMLARQLDKLYYVYLKNQIEPELWEKHVVLVGKIQDKYNTYYSTIDNKKASTSNIGTILTTEKDCLKRELAWRANRQVGDAIVDSLIELVKLRNEVARKVGFDNYHTLSIHASELNVQELDRLFDELHKLTGEPFARLKEELDLILADSYGIAPDDLMPWHYHDPFFQRTPLVYDLDLDLFYKHQDIREVAQRYYSGIGLPVDDILARSDLYGRDGKYPHAFSHDVDRRGDVRVLCNLQNTERWMETILHELGHAVYSKYHDRKEPWLLREPAHSFTTEAIAMLFGRLSRNAAWLQQMLGLTDAQRAKIEKASTKYTRFQQILFARWVMVMYNFEKQLYADPEQDLNTLWWDLVERYQLIKRPPGPADAGWASKLHFINAPCYYHNYVLGELLASQLHNHIVHQVLMLKSDEGFSYVGRREIGNFLREKVFGPGAVYHWNDMVAQATGEPLTPKYFVEQFIK